MVIDLATINFCPGQGGGGGEAVLEHIRITDNGKYVPGVGVDGWNEVDVEVPMKEEIDLSWHIIENGTVTFNAPEGKTYKKVVMDVEVPEDPAIEEKVDIILGV